MNPAAGYGMHTPRVGMQHGRDRSHQLLWQATLWMALGLLRSSRLKPAPEQRTGLEHMPHSWLHQLIISLPPKDRLALFQTCRQLSRQVVVSSPTVTIRLQGSVDWQYKRRASSLAVDAGLVMQACAVLWGLYCIWTNQHHKFLAVYWPLALAQIFLLSLNTIMYLLALWRSWRRAGKMSVILHARQNIQLSVGTLPIPQQLQSSITALELRDHQPSLFYWRVQVRWHELTSLQQLTVHNVSYLALLHLDKYLAAGHLEGLQRLSFYPRASEGVCLRLGNDIIQTVVTQLGARLQHLATNCEELWAQLHKFTELHIVELGPAYLQPQPEQQLYAELSVDVLRQICEHPTLRTVTLRACCSDGYSGFASGVQFSCKWEALIMDGTQPSILGKLALTGLQEIRFVNGLPGCAEADAAQLQRVLAAHGLSITCGSGSFWLQSGPSSEACQLLSHFTDMHTLRLLGPTVQLQSPELWALLPHSLSSLDLWHVRRSLVEGLWHYLPESVNSIWLNACDMPSEALATLLTTTPAQVRTVTLTPRSTEELLQWAMAGMSNKAPCHVLVAVRPAASSAAAL